MHYLITYNLILPSKKEINEIFEKEYYLTTNNDTIKYFRRIGGTETITRNYTCAGYKVVKIVSTSPDKQTKIVREFEFKDIEKPKEKIDFNLFVGSFSKYPKIWNLLKSLDVLYIKNFQSFGSTHHQSQL